MVTLMLGQRRRWEGNSLSGLGAQSDYDRVNDLQNKITTVRAGIYSVGKDIWDTVAGAIYKAGTIPSEIVGGYFPGFDWAGEESLRILQSLIVTEGSFPSASAINLADQRIREFGSMVGYVKKVAPTIASKISTDMAEAKSKVEAVTPLKDPAVVGRETFIKELQERTAALIPSTGFWTVLGIGAAAAAVLAGVILLRR